MVHLNSTHVSACHLVFASSFNPAIIVTVCWYFVGGENGRAMLSVSIYSQHVIWFCAVADVVTVSVYDFSNHHIIVPLGTMTRSDLDAWLGGVLYTLATNLMRSHNRHRHTGQCTCETNRNSYSLPLRAQSTSTRSNPITRSANTDKQIPHTGVQPH